MRKTQGTTTFERRLPDEVEGHIEGLIVAPIYRSNLFTQKIHIKIGIGKT